MATLNGQIALVTGASRGIGQAIALRLGREGATVIGTATSPDGAAAIQAGFDVAGINGWGAVLNVTEPAACEALLAEVEQRYGPVSVLVNNAGITRDNLALRMKEEEWDAVIDTNLKSVYRMSKLVIRGMMKTRKGRIINITSVVAASGNPGQVNYTAAKAGVEGLSRSLAQELGSRNITVNCVAPGLIDTDMTRGLAAEHRQAMLRSIPLNRLGQADDVAAAVAFLASSDASYVTGVTLHVNGGMYMV